MFTQKMLQILGKFNKEIEHGALFSFAPYMHFVNCPLHGSCNGLMNELAHKYLADVN